MGDMTQEEQESSNLTQRINVVDITEEENSRGMEAKIAVSQFCKLDRLDCQQNPLGMPCLAQRLL